VGQFVLARRGSDQPFEFVAEMALISKAGIVGHLYNIIAAGKKFFGPVDA